MASVSGKERILILDDDSNMLELLRRHLSARGYEVVTTAEVSEAIRVLAARPLALVITALKTSTGNRQELIKYIRKNFTQTEVMIIVGDAAIREAVKAAKAGAAEYLIKPFTEEELFAVVQKTLGKQSMRQAAEAHTSPDKPVPATSMQNCVY
ncbi:MAG: Response regulator MprA [bacterium]|nr:Response regulator MprA [bacterium]